MNTCPVCKRTVEDEALYCPGCGAAQRETLAPSNTPFQSSLSPPPFPSTYSSPAPVKEKLRNPWIAALLNFFIPGAGYVYNGVGYDGPQVVFGIIVFLSVFIGFYIPLIGQAFLPSGSSGTSAGYVSAIEVLSILLLILPFGLAYDAYRRASRALLH